MAKVNVKLFGVLRVDSHISETDVKAEKVSDVFDELNSQIADLQKNETAERPADILFKNTAVFINGDRCTHKGQKLSDGDEVWLLSPASGG